MLCAQEGYPQENFTYFEQDADKKWIDRDRLDSKAILGDSLIPTCASKSMYMRLHVENRQLEADER